MRAVVQIDLRQKAGCITAKTLCMARTCTSLAAVGPHRERSFRRGLPSQRIITIRPTRARLAVGTTPRSFGERQNRSDAALHAREPRKSGFANTILPETTS